MVLPIDYAICREPASRMTCDSVELTDEVLSEAKAKLLEKGYRLDDYKFIYRQNTLR